MNLSSRLEYLVRRFRERWESNPQYRAIVIGGVGLAVILTMCACAGVLTLAGNGALASFGFGGGNPSQINSHTGTGPVTGASSFPTPTFSSANVATNGGPTPVGNPLQNSRTPVPAPTSAPGCNGIFCGGGPGGGGGGGGCHNCSVTVSQSPNPWVAGQTGNLVFHTSSPNVGLAIIYNLPGCGTYTDEPAGQTDGSGNATISYLLPSCVHTGTGNVTVFAHFGNSQVTNGILVACKV